MLSKFPPFKTSLLFLCILCGIIFAQWDTYPTYDEFLEIMNKFETDYPNLCKIEEIGESVQGRKLLCAKITDSITTDEKEPEFFYGAAIEGDEAVGFILMLRLIDYLCANYGNDTLVNKLVDSVEIWISPLGDPDEIYERPKPPFLNRNFPCACMQGNHKYYGIYNSWELETKAFLDFFDEHSFVIGADIHSGTECAIWPYASIKERPVDSLWYKMVSKQYRDSAQEYSPADYFDSNGGAINHYTGLYEAHGTRIDCLAYHKFCRALNLEICNTKMPDASTLPDYWNYNYRPLLNYMQQVLYGIRGTVTDTTLGIPIDKVKIFVNNHDKDSSFVRSHLPHGDYYRPIYAGTYDVTFSCDGWHPKTFKNVHVENNKATILNVELSDIPQSITSKINSFSGISIDILESTLKT